MDSIQLPEKVKIFHGEDIGSVSSDGKEYYVPYKRKRAYGDVHVQKFDYKIPSKSTGLMFMVIAHNTSNNKYHVYIQEVQIGQTDTEAGLMMGLRYKHTLTQSGNMHENKQAVDQSVYNALEKYIENVMKD